MQVQLYNVLAPCLYLHFLYRQRVRLSPPIILIAILYATEHRTEYLEWGNKLPSGCIYFYSARTEPIENGMDFRFHLVCECSVCQCNYSSARASKLPKKCPRCKTTIRPHNRIMHFP